MQSILKPCDIIFSYSVKDELDELIAECGLNYKKIKINHVGLLINHTSVIEATHKGVITTPVNDFISSTINVNGIIYIKRVNFYLSKIQKTRIVDEAKKYLNFSYNFNFKDNTKEIYCSELVILAFNALNTLYGKYNPFKRHAITFNNPYINKFEERWLKYYDNNISNIPFNQLGSHPASLYANKQTHIIKVIKK